MAHVLLIDDDSNTLVMFRTILQSAGHMVLTASCGAEGIQLLRESLIDVVLSDLRLPDVSGLDILRTVRRQRESIGFVMVTGFANTRDAVTAMRLGAVDFVEKPVFRDELLQVVEEALAIASLEQANRSGGSSGTIGDSEAHAAARWACAVVSLMDSPKDCRKISEWGRWIAVSRGALRNWCRTAGIGSRRSLVFGRMLRAVSLGKEGRHQPANVLNVVDRRTLKGLLVFAGFSGEIDFPIDEDDFLRRQTLVQDPDALREIKRALSVRHQGLSESSPCARHAI